jgi:hypothetical protein
MQHIWDALVNNAADFQTGLCILYRESPQDIIQQDTGVKVVDDKLQLAGFDFGEIQNVIDYFHQAASGFVHNLIVLFLFRVGVHLHQHLQEAHNAV